MCSPIPVIVNLFQYVSNTTWPLSLQVVGAAVIKNRYLIQTKFQPSIVYRGMTSKIATTVAITTDLQIPAFFLYLSHTIYFSITSIKSLSSVITTSW